MILKDKKRKGITLVALVVTIIVLLILAGVSLNLMTGSNGILGKAANAVDKNTKEVAKEELELKLAEWSEEFYEQKYVKQDLETDMTKKDYVKEQIKSNGNGKSYQITVDENYGVILKDANNKEELETGIVNEQGGIDWKNGANTNQSNFNYDNYIAIKGKSGTTSEKKELEAGIYEINYFGASFTFTPAIPYGQVFVNDECKFSERGTVIDEGTAGGCAYSCSGITATIILEEKSEVYLKIAEGSCRPCGMITMFKIGDKNEEKI